MAAQNRPTFSELSSDEATALLKRHHVGRLAFTFHDRVDIEPISYVYADGWVYARTSPGTKLTTVRHHPWVAFEVDEIESRFSWESVVIRGSISFLDANRGPGDREAYDAALSLLREADAGALSEADPTPHRQVLFRIHADELHGRRATPGD